MAFPTTNLIARYEASLESGYVDNDAIYTPVDQSGNGYGLTTGNGTPVYKTGIIGGNAVYRYNGSSFHNGSGPNTAESALTLCIVVNSGTAASGRELAIFSLNNATSAFAALYEDTGEWKAWVRNDSSTNQTVSTSGADTTADAVLTMEFGGGSLGFWVNGSSVGSASISGTVTDLKINIAQLSEYFTGDVALAAAWSSVLGATERANLHTYVQDTYGITVSDYSGGTTPTGGLTFPRGVRRGVKRGSAFARRQMEKINGIWRPTSGLILPAGV